MYRFILIIFLVLAAEKLQAQVVFRLIHPKLASNEAVYLAGSINSWQPNSENFKATKFNDTISFLILPKAIAEMQGAIEFKFTLGSWEKVETSEKGKDIANREWQKDASKANKAAVSDTFTYRIQTWKNKVETTNTVVGNLQTLPLVHINRRVRVWLPPNFNPANEYAVVYCFDGQNLFDAAEAPFGEWHLDETLLKLNADGKPILAIAIDHGSEKRISEYTPFEDSEHPTGDGDSVLKAIVEQILPQAEQELGLRVNRTQRALLGSSLGGLMSAYGLLKYQKYFSKAAIFSPAFWINKDSLNDFTDDIELSKQTKAYILAGGKESTTMVKDAQVWLDILSNKRKIKTKLKIVANGTHSESFWSAELEQALRYLFF